MKKLNDVLVLNRNWVALHIINWRKAISLIYQDAAHALDKDYISYTYNDWQSFSTANAEDYAKISTVSYSVAIPEIVVLTKYDRLPTRDVKFSRENILHRDKYKCQYCGGEFTVKELTVDHINPRCLGGKNTWENLVACCKDCNTKKADKSLAQVGMRLIKKPIKPNWLNPITNARVKAHICKSWSKFLGRMETE